MGLTQKVTFSHHHHYQFIIIIITIPFLLSSQLTLRTYFYLSLITTKPTLAAVHAFYMVWPYMQNNAIWLHKDPILHNMPSPIPMTQSYHLSYDETPWSTASVMCTTTNWSLPVRCSLLIKCAADIVPSWEQMDVMTYMLEIWIQPLYN